jgi:hypothetical protein
MPAALTEVLELAATGDDAVDAAAALAVAEAALARAETRMRGLSPAERTTAAGRLAEARGLLARAARRTRGDGPGAATSAAGRGSAWWRPSSSPRGWRRLPTPGRGGRDPAGHRPGVAAATAGGP